jgi:cysteine desulfurase
MECYKYYDQAYHNISFCSGQACYNPVNMGNHSSKIYLDYAATTPVDERVLEAMLPYFGNIFGNPSSVHSFGQAAEAAMESAREMIAQELNCQPAEVIFTSCGSESDNLAIRGAAFAARNKRSANHILISPVEHHAVSRTADQLAKLHDFEVEYLPVDEAGMVHGDGVAKRLRPDTALVSVIYANNEIGTINPIAEIGHICRGLGIPFHTDAVQAAAYLPIDVQALKVDLMSLGAHKFYGPKGVGALYVRKGTPILPAQTGGGQESGLRAGTSNIPYIVGMAEALHIVQTKRVRNTDQLMQLRDHLIGEILESVPDSRLTGHPSARLPNHASFTFKDVDGNALLMLLDVAGFACSSGSACKTGDPEPSEVLTALGLERQWALGSLRVTLGKDTTASQVEVFLRELPGLIQRVRQLNQ